MQVPPVNTIWTEGWHFYHFVIAALSGGVATRILVYVSKKMPPLPAKAGFWQTWMYALVSGASGLDPNATLTTKWDGKAERRAPKP
jgi:hypothetical protein